MACRIEGASVRGAMVRSGPAGAVWAALVVPWSGGAPAAAAGAPPSTSCCTTCACTPGRMTIRMAAWAGAPTATSWRSSWVVPPPRWVHGPRAGGHALGKQPCTRLATARTDPLVISTQEQQPPLMRVHSVTPCSCPFVLPPCPQLRVNGIRLSRTVPAVGAAAVGQLLRSIAPRVMTWRQLAAAHYSQLARRHLLGTCLGGGVERFRLDWTRCLDHFALHAGARRVGGGGGAAGHE
jgi:hypothetical protein